MIYVPVCLRHCCFVSLDNLIVRFYYVFILETLVRSLSILFTFYLNKIVFSLCWSILYRSDVNNLYISYVDSDTFMLTIGL